MTIVDRRTTCRKFPCSNLGVPSFTPLLQIILDFQFLCLVGTFGFFLRSNLLLWVIIKIGHILTGFIWFSISQWRTLKEWPTRYVRTSFVSHLVGSVTLEIIIKLDNNKTAELSLCVFIPGGHYLKSGLFHWWTVPARKVRQYFTFDFQQWLLVPTWKMP